jgi:ribosomal protein L15E
MDKEVQEKFVNLRRMASFFVETDGIDRYYSLQK